MALWNEKPTPATAGPVVPPSTTPPERSSPERSQSEPALAVSPRRPTPKTSSEGGESVIAANLTIEGKIEAAHVPFAAIGCRNSGLLKQKIDELDLFPKK